MTSLSTLPLFAVTGTCWFRNVQSSHPSEPKLAPFPCWYPPTPHPHPRPAYHILLPAVYDHIALAVNLKANTWGGEVPEVGRKDKRQPKFQTFLLVPRCKNLGHMYFNVSSKASSFLPPGWRAE